MPVYKTPAEWQTAMSLINGPNDPFRNDPAVNVRGIELIAGETYSARLDCNPLSPGTSVSAAVEGTLWAFGDTDNNRDINITDVLRILTGFSNVFHTLSCTDDVDCAVLEPYNFCDTGSCLWLTRENVDIAGVTVGCAPDRDISINDALTAINAFAFVTDSCFVVCP